MTAMAIGTTAPVPELVEGVEVVEGFISVYTPRKVPSHDRES